MSDKDDLDLADTIEFRTFDKVSKEIRSWDIVHEIRANGEHIVSFYIYNRLYKIAHGTSAVEAYDKMLRDIASVAARAVIVARLLGGDI